jgi:hypothetical protein
MENYELDLIKIIGLEPVNTDSWDEHTWKNVYELAREHEMHCLLFHVLNHQRHISWRQFSLAEKWQNEYLEETFNLQHVMKEVEFMLVELSYAKVDYVVLKGSSLKEYYPNTFVRLMSDVDILVDIQDMDTITMLFEQQGYRIQKTTTKDVSFVKEGKIPFEVHHTLFTPIHMFNGEAFSKLAFDTKVLIGNHQYRLSREANIAYIIGHATKHLYYMGIGLKVLYDIYISIQAHQEPINRSLLIDYLTQLCCLKTGIHLIELCNRYFSLGYEHGYVVDEVLLDWLIEKIIKSGRLGQSEYSLILTILSLEHEKGQSKAMTRLKLLFPNREFMEESYGELDKKPWMLLVYWIIRWGNLLRSKDYVKHLFKGMDQSIVDLQATRIQQLKDEVIHKVSG